MTNIVEPNNLAIGRIEERNTELTLVTRLLNNCAGIPLGLREHPLGSEREFLGLDNASNAAAVTEGIIRRPGCRGQFRHS